MFVNLENIVMSIEWRQKQYYDAIVCKVKGFPSFYEFENEHEKNLNFTTFLFLCVIYASFVSFTILPYKKHVFQSGKNCFLCCWRWHKVTFKCNLNKILKPFVYGLLVVYWSERCVSTFPLKINIHKIYVVEMDIFIL